jgi:hypothetical protein
MGFTFAPFQQGGVLSGRSTGAGKSAWKASFPAFHAPAQTFRFPGPMECGT